MVSMRPTRTESTVVGCATGRARARRIAALVLLFAGCTVPPGGGVPDGADAALAGDGAGGTGARRVRRGFLRDREGRALLLRGANVSSVHKQKPYLDFHLESDYAKMRTEWGMNAVRFLIVWAAVEPSRGKFDDAYLAKVQTRMEWARRAGLHVFLDMHQDLFGEGFSGGDGAPRWACDEKRYAAFTPMTPWFLGYASAEVVACFDGLYKDDGVTARFVEAWRHVAGRLGSAEAVLGFDPLNEPHWGSSSVYTFERDRLEAFYTRVIQAVRSEAPSWVAFVEPAISRNLLIPTGLRPFALADIVYAPHAYDAPAERGEGFDPARRSDLIANLASLAGEAASLEGALVIGEYGGVAADKGIAEYMDAVYDGAAASAASAIYWHYGKDSGYGLLDSTGAEKKALLDAIVRPYPELVAGDPISFSFDEKTRALVLVFVPDATVAAPTQLVLPARVYPSGYEVECGGCTVEEGSGVARLGVVAAEGGRATVRVTAR
jgi:endoglycosylceramidase